MYPSPVLRQKCAPVAPEEVRSPRVQGVIADLLATVRFHDGLGLAAPQLGVLERLFVMRRPLTALKGRDLRRQLGASRLERRYDVFINPRLVAASERQELGPEGCLSLPEHPCFVRRKWQVDFECLNEDGAAVKRRLTGLPAVIAQHEFDHLDGVLIVDREVKDLEGTEEEQRAMERYEYSLAKHYRGEVWHDMDSDPVLV